MSAETCRRDHAGSTARYVCPVVCAACGHGCPAHYWDGRYCQDQTPSCGCSWVDPDPKIAWRDGYARAVEDVTAKFSTTLESLVDSIYDAPAPAPGEGDPTP